MKRKKFSVIEYSGHFSVRNNETNQERIMGDGVDTLFTPTGKAMLPGSEHFRRVWERDLNRNASDTEAAYFRK